MIIGVPKEILPKEHRVAALPETVREYVKMGFNVLVESSLAEGISRPNAEYEDAGARIIESPEALFARSDIILKVKQPCFNQTVGKHEAEMIREGAILITFLHPAAPSNHEMIRTLCDRNVTSFTMDGVPRIPRAQKMDALTSMSTVTGYKSVLIAADRFPKLIPMIGTAIGTTKPARFLIVGAGVVGLQAIATARRLGAMVKAVDIREEARQEAGSLKAKVVGFEVPPEQATREGGYAKALPPELLERERQTIRPLVEESDILILSALVPGEVAPVLVTEPMVKSMKPGSVIVDVAVDQGGNCAVTEPSREIVKHGVCVCGLANIPGSVPVHASWLYSNNVFHYVENLFKNGVDVPDMDDEIVRHTLVTFQTKIIHAGTLKAMAQPGR